MHCSGGRPACPLAKDFGVGQAKAGSGGSVSRKTVEAGVSLAWLLQRSPTVLLIPGRLSVEHLRVNGANGMSDIEGKAAREAVSERGQRANFNAGVAAQPGMEEQ